MTSLLTITYKGQVTLSKAILSALGLSRGDRITAKVVGKKAILEPVGGGILDLAGTFHKINLAKGKTVDDLIHEAREILHAKTIR